MEFDRGDVVVFNIKDKEYDGIVLDVKETTLKIKCESKQREIYKSEIISKVDTRTKLKGQLKLNSEYGKRLGMTRNILQKSNQ